MPVVRLETQDRVGHIILDRPPANSYDAAFVEDLSRAVDGARSDDSVKAIVVRSASEKFFSAGADVSFFAKSSPDEQMAFVARANEAMGKLEATPKVVIAAINGHCLGGGLEIALCCDFRIAAEGGYKIGLPEVTLGLLPGTGGTQRLPRIIGKNRAIDLMVTGRMLTPKDALEWGLVNRVFPREKFWEETMAFARGLTYPHHAARAVGLIKRSVTEGLEMSMYEGLALERELQNRLFAMADAKEGFRAFLEKRKPVFHGK